MNKLKKTLTIFLASMLAITGTFFSANNAFAVKYTVNSNVGTSYYYSQAGWWNYGSDRRSNKNGCGITAIATAISVLYRRRVTPKTVANVAAKRGYWDLRGNTPRSLTKNIASAARLKVTTIGKSAKSMVKALYYGAVLVIRATGTAPFTNGGHYVAVVGARSDGYFKVVDPGHSNYRPKWVHYTQFLSSMHSPTIFALKRR